MGIAFSGEHAPEQIYYGTFTGSDLNSYITEWDTRFRSAGWVLAATITGGFRYTITSPEGLKARVEMWQDGINNTWVWFRMTSADGARVGTSFYIVPIGNVLDATPQTMVLWCNPCQWFIAKAGSNGSGEYWPRSVMGGIPKTAACDAAVADESWWMLGESSIGTFRRSCEPYSTFSVCTDGVLRASPSAAYEADWLRIVRRVWTAWSHWDEHDAYHANDGVLFPDGTGILYDPLIAWSVTDGKVAPIQGELWDSFMDTKEATLEATRSTTEPVIGGGTATRQWANFMQGPKGSIARANASLWLLLPGTGIRYEANVAY